MTRSVATLIMFATVCVAAPLLSSYYVGLLTEAAILALFAMSLDLLVGYLGLESLGHAAFFGIAAYVTGLLSLAGYHSIWVSLPAALFASCLLAALFGLIALRTIGPYFLIITMALGYLPLGLAIRWRSLTGGDDGLAGVGRPNFGLPISLTEPRAYLIFTWTICVAAALVLYLLGGSAFGLSLRGIKENPSRMEALGYNIWLHKYVAFVVAGTFAGISGVLYAYLNGFVSPYDMSIYRSAEALVAVILGGAGTLAGPALGAAIILMLRFTAGAVTDKWSLVLGLVYIVVVMFAPRGVLGLLAFRRPSKAFHEGARAD